MALTRSRVLIDAATASHILDSMAAGVDPATGEELPHSVILQKADVLRALVAGSAALKIVDKRDKRRAHIPKNNGKPWTAEEDNLLAQRHGAGETPEQLAAKHGRTLRAIEVRLEGNGLLARSDRRTGGYSGSARRRRRKTTTTLDAS